jgi:3-hydroxyacyl-CoA dehydrogenase
MRLGLVPGAGGTQRLPRLLGAEAALLLMSTGQKLDAAAASEIGLIDSLLPEPTAAAAVAFAEALLAEGLGPRPTLALTEFTSRGAVWLGAVAVARAALSPKSIPAQRCLVDCVEAALLLPPAAGLDFECTAFMECLASSESAALRHLFLAERQIPAKLGVRRPDGTIRLNRAGFAGG